MGPLAGECDVGSRSLEGKIAEGVENCFYQIGELDLQHRCGSAILEWCGSIGPRVV